MSDLEQKRREVRQRLIEENEFPNIPEDWGVERLRFLFTESKERNGKSPVGEMLSVSEYRGVVPREYDNEEQKRNDDELENYRVVRPGQLAVNSMWLNHLGLGVSEHTGHVSPAYNVYNISDRLDRRLVHHLMRSNYYLKIYLRYLYGIRPNSFQIKSNDWASIPIIVPDLPTQRAIADFLDRETARIDLLIEKKQRLVALLRRKLHSKQQLEIDDLFKTFGNSRLKNFTTSITTGPFGSAIKQDEYIEGGVPILNPAHISDGKIMSDSSVTLTEEKFRDLCYWRLLAGDLLMGRRGELGRCAVVEDDFGDGICGTGCLRLRVSPKNNPSFLQLIISSRRASEWLNLHAVGTTMKNLNEAIVGGLPVPNARREQQNKFVSDIKNASQKNFEACQKITLSVERLKEYRSALITAAVTGQIDVSTYAKSGATERFLDKVEK